MTGEAKEQLRNAAHGAATEFKESYNPKPHMQNPVYKAPGRLGDPRKELEDEPRVHASLLETARQYGMAKHVPPTTLPKLHENSSLDEIAEMVAEFEDGVMVLYAGGVLPLDIPEDANEPKVEMTKQTIKGGDGQDMLVYIYRPAGQNEALPGVVYTHGGGMTIIPTYNPVHDRWCTSISAQGCVVVMPDFRNAYTKTAYHHFPKGLNDCVAAVKWTIANKESLRIRNIVLQGESGGANLACAIALTANREGWVKDIAGIFAVVPFISNAYGWSEERLLKELPSLVECNGYFLERQATAFLAHFYTPTDEHQTNPLAWPYHASLEDMKGLPPHMLVMDELDMLRDEGCSYARRLVKAGVDAKGSVNLGVIHGTSLIFRNSVKEFNKGAVRDIAAFAKSL